ncbi:hypothetical protein GALL_423950 [mine drainage metagenome]|uniref:Uncharacterized protein n=1 Tax=mine drainage metagenome TaxID=410659 RepID=A0A1J5Q7S9_9ZZZZ
MLDPNLGILQVLLEGGREQILRCGRGNFREAAGIRPATDKVREPTFGKVAGERVGVPIDPVVAQRGIARRVGDGADVGAGENLDLVLAGKFFHCGDALRWAACVTTQQSDFSAGNAAFGVGLVARDLIAARDLVSIQSHRTGERVDDGDTERIGLPPREARGRRDCKCGNREPRTDNPYHATPPSTITLLPLLHPWYSHRSCSVNSKASALICANRASCQL